MRRARRPNPDASGPSLLNDLETLDKIYGIESRCVAASMGVAMIVERLN